MFMKHHITLFLSLASFSLFAAEFEPFAGPKPLVVLIQSDPWAMVIGADTPRVVVYDDGTLIFLKQSGDSASYHQKNLSATELSDLRKRLVPTLELKDLKRSYNLVPRVTDQPESLFYIRDGQRELTTRVYGLKAAGTKLPAFTELENKRQPDPVPEQLLELHKFLSTLDYSDDKEWAPRYLEVMIWPYEYAPGALITWPKDWPGLESERSFKRKESYSIFLDGSQLPELREFLRTRKENGAVEIGGKKWAVSFRAVFPSEPVWRNAFKSTPALSRVLPDNPLSPVVLDLAPNVSSILTSEQVDSLAVRLSKQHLTDSDDLQAALPPGFRLMPVGYGFCSPLDANGRATPYTETTSVCRLSKDRDIVVIEDNRTGSQIISKWFIRDLSKINNPEQLR